MKSVETILAGIDYLPPFSGTVAKVFKMLGNPRTHAEAIADTVKFDQALTTSIIRVCNSSYFGLRRTVNNLREAVVYIGLSELKKIIVRSGTRQYFENPKPGYEIQQGELWRHAIAVSIIANHLEKKIDATNGDYVFIAGLLHDVGKLVLSKFVEDASDEILKKVDVDGISFLEAEQKVLGIGHAEVGAKILDRWGFPPEIVTAVGKHHTPSADSDSPLDDIVRLSDSLAMLMGYETSVDGLAYQGYSDLGRKYGLNHEAIEKIMADSLDEIKMVESEFGFAREV